MTNAAALHAEIAALKQRVAELERIEAEYKQAQAALTDAGSEWENLLEAVGDSVFIIDPLKMTILDANDHAARRLGYTRQELLSLPYSAVEVEHEGDSSERESSSSRTRFYERAHRHRSGALIPVEISSRIIRHQGRPALLNLARDISARKRQEDEREQLIAELDAYAHTVAHDLKNPVALMMGYAEILADDSHPLSANELKEYMEVIRKASVKMQAIIDELLLLARVRKMDQIATEPLDMQAIAQEALQRLANMIQESGAAVSAPKEWPAAAGYAAWVEEIWVNYISNAIKYGGTPPVIALGATPQGSLIKFWTRDNGPGIDPANQARLFKPFTRFDQARAEGHGLGLSIVASIAAKLGGEAGASRLPEGGSEFYFTLPAA